MTVILVLLMTNNAFLINPVPVDQPQNAFHSLVQNTASENPFHVDFDKLLETDTDKSSDLSKKSDSPTTPVLQKNLPAVSAPTRDPEAEKKLRELVGDEGFYQDLKLEEDNQKKIAPPWEPIVVEFAVPGYDPMECCGRIIRSTRASAEEACRALGRKVWSIQSDRPTVTTPPLRYKDSCAIFEIRSKEKLTGYSCKSKATAKCIINAE